MAVPGPVTSERSAGCNWLIQQGAKLVQSADDVFEELPAPYRDALGPEVALPADGRAEGGSAPAAATADERVVLDLLREAESVQLDTLADRVPFGIARLQTALFGLEVRGVVEVLPGKFYRVRRLAGGTLGAAPRESE
jgi:DNA processing protein